MYWDGVHLLWAAADFLVLSPSLLEDDFPAESDLDLMLSDESPVGDGALLRRLLGFEGGVVEVGFPLILGGWTQRLGDFTKSVNSNTNDTV